MSNTGEVPRPSDDSSRNRRNHKQESAEADSADNEFGVENTQAGEPHVAVDRRTCFHRHRVSRIRRTTVGAKVIVRDGESVEQALRRLRQFIFKGNRWPVYRPKPTKRRQDYHQTAGQLERQRAGLAKSRAKLNSNRYTKPYSYLQQWHDQHPYACSCGCVGRATQSRRAPDAEPGEAPAPATSVVSRVQLPEAGTTE